MINKFIQHKKYFFLFLIIFLGAFLRFYKVSAVPPGLYIDEISIAYNANEILTKGVDQYGVKDPLWFKAFGEYKMPVYIYLTAGSIAVFGRNDFAVRFPSVASGILTLLIFYFLVEELAAFAKKILPIQSNRLALVATLILAISPWHIQFSRAGFEATTGLCIYLLGLLLAVLAHKKQKISFLVLGFLFLSLTMYAYNIYRVVALITVFAITIIFLKTRKRMGKIFLSLLLFFVVSIPIIIFSFSGAGGERFAETSAFSSYASFSIIQKIIHYPIIFLSNYLSFFSLNFLFNFGDGIGRHQMANFGVMQYWEFPFLIIGLYFFVRNWKNPFYFLILLLLFLAPFAAAFAQPSPQTLRSFLMVIPFTIIVSYGFAWTIKKLLTKKRIFVFLIIVGVITYEFLFYLHAYYQHYSIINSIDWGSGYEEMVAKTVKYESKFKYIVIDPNLGTNVIPLYYGFYTDDKLKPQIVSSGWEKPKEWEKGATLYIRPYYNTRSNSNIINNVYLPGQNKDIFAQFWKL